MHSIFSVDDASERSHGQQQNAPSAQFVSAVVFWILCTNKQKHVRMHYSNRNVALLCLFSESSSNRFQHFPIAQSILTNEKRMIKSSRKKRNIKKEMLNLMLRSVHENFFKQKNERSVVLSSISFPFKEYRLYQRIFDGFFNFIINDLKKMNF